MGSLFRSEEMSLCQVFIQPEAAYSFLSRIGEAGMAQFLDLNKDLSGFQRKYVSEVRRCEEMERRLRNIEGVLKKETLGIPTATPTPKAPNAREATQLEMQLEHTESEIMELTTNAINLKTNYLEVMEFKFVLDKTQSLFEEQEEPVQVPLSREERASQAKGQLGFIAGVIKRGKIAAFERMLWRISMGNVFLRQAELQEKFIDPSSGNEIYKTVFVAFFQGEQLRSKVEKICKGFHATVYKCPTSYSEREEMLIELNIRLQDLNLVLNRTEEHRHKVLYAVSKEIDSWSVLVKKMKAIYYTMNFFSIDVTEKCLVGECWVPSADYNVLSRALIDGSKDVGSSTIPVVHPIHTKRSHPTFNRCNKFTKGFQNLIDAYGIASYEEVNPGLFTIITFPFLFAIMFGDMGHGLVLAVFGAYMVLFEEGLANKKTDNEIWNLFFGGRYIILLMGLFSLYTGAVYNEMFSVSFNVFGSSWKVNYTMPTVMHNSYLILDPLYDYEKTPYPFGLDPVWQFADNKINFHNSFKMKLSIIIGVVHMLFGVSLSVANHLHFKKPIYIVVEFIPQFLFLLLIFFYLVILVFIKWVNYSVDSSDVAHGSSCAPSVLILFIQMMLFTDAGKPANPKCVSNYMYSNQRETGIVLMLLALLCIPVLLVGKPIYLLVFKKRKLPQMEEGIELQNGHVGNSLHKEEEGVEEEEHGEAGEIIIHQMIHTIEYVLSTISHTASYLRLWALSLAHGQLSDVLWEMVLRHGLHVKSLYGVIVLFFIFAFWAVLTVAILVMMEGLSAFLHTLRLHWVEFMSKFYTGNGYPFQPFSFKKILEEENI